MTNGIIDRFRTMPIRSMNVITGHVVASMVRNLLTTSIVIIIALLVGFRPTVNMYSWFEVVGVITLFILTVTWFFAAIGLVASTPTAASSYGFVFLFLP
ncbi:MAG TPA: ABC transporter permease [Rummeliibacillus sp.]|nr:ABC transporter permease [Rummeliibacillus sp.]